MAKKLPYCLSSMERAFQRRKAGPFKMPIPGSYVTVSAPEPTELIAYYSVLCAPAKRKPSNYQPSKALISKG
jgi:hypothetical protein